MADHAAKIEAIAAQIDANLRAAASQTRAVAEKGYLKSELEFLGCGVPATRAAIKAARKAHPTLGHDEVLTLARLLWDAPLYERRLAAVEVLAAYGGRLESADIDLVEGLIREAGTWALVDPLAITVVARLVERDAALGATLDRWAADADFWLRRAALLPALSGGVGEVERFLSYADAMLEEHEFFVRKAIGWVLRAISKQRPNLVYAWLAPRITRASGVTVREAVKYLPPEQRESLLHTYRSGKTDYAPPSPRLRGLLKGRIAIPPDFDDPLPEEVLASFEADL